MASNTQRSHSSFETWKTPYPSFGILTPLRNVTYSMIHDFLSIGLAASAKALHGETFFVSDSIVKVLTAFQKSRFVMEF